MTILEIVESIQERFPDVSLRECLKKMSVAQREFAASTTCLVGPYLVAIADLTNGYWVVDENILYVRQAIFVDTNGDNIETDFVLNVSAHTLQLYNTDGSKMTTYPGSATHLKLWCTLLPDHLVEDAGTLTDVPVIYDRFHMALYHGAIMELASLKGRPDLFASSQGSFYKLFIEGKKYANRESNDIYDVQGRQHYVDATVVTTLDSVPE